MQKYDFLIVGAGLFGATFAYEAAKKGYKCLVIDRRNHIGGNCYTENIEDIEVHKYGAHIFHTNDDSVWQWINQFSKFEPFINSPIAVVDGITYNLPFNMNLFSKVFGVVRPREAKEIIEKERKEFNHIEPKNLEEQAIKLVGKTIYEMFIKGYTEKQWGKSCKDLPPEIIKRLPLRWTYDNNYFSDKYHGIPKNGYTKLFEKILTGIEVRLGISYEEVKDKIKAKKVIYTGAIDEFFDYQYGCLEYRSLQFVHLKKNCTNWRGNAVINYPDLSTPYTRSIEHKHFIKNNNTLTTIVSYEFSIDYQPNFNEPYYPIGDEKNRKLYNRYLELAKKVVPNVIFGGRLGSYRYFDMDDTIIYAFLLVKEILYG